MDQYDISTRATETAINSQGSAMRENEEYMKSYEARIQQMKTAWETLSLTVGDDVLGDSIVKVTGLITGLTNIITYSVDKFGAFPTVFSVLSVSIYAVSSAFRTMMFNLQNSVRTMLGLAPATAAARTGFITLTGAITTTKVALKGLMSATIVGALFAILGTVLEKLITGFDKAKESQQDYFDNLKQNISGVQSEIDSITSLTSKLKDHTLSQEERKSTYEELARLSPKIISHYTAEGDAIYKTKEQIDALLQSELERLNLKKQLAVQDAVEGLGVSAKEIESNRKEVEKLTEEWDKANAKSGIMEYARQFIEANNMIELQKGSKDSFSDALKLDELVAQLNKDIKKKLKENGLKPDDFIYSSSSLKHFSLDDIVSRFEHFESQMESIDNKIKAGTSSIADGLNLYKETFKQIADVSTFGVEDKNVNLFLQNMADSFVETSNITEENSDVIQKNFKKLVKEITSASKNKSIDLSKIIETGNVDELIEKFPEYTDAFKHFSDSITNTDDVSAKLPVYNELGVEIGKAANAAELAAQGFTSFEAVLDDDDAVVGYTVSTNALNSALNDLTERVSSAKEGIELLETAEKELDESNHISIETLQKVIEKYGDRIDVTNLTKENIGKLIEEIRKEEVAQVNAENTKTKVLIEQTKKRIDAMRKEMLAISALINSYAPLVESGQLSEEQAEKLIGGRAKWNSGSASAIATAEKELALLEASLSAASSDILSYSSKSVSSKSSKSKSSSSSKQYLDDTQAIINAINKESVAREELNKAVEERAKALEDEERYADAIDKTTTLLASQNKEIELLNSANSNLNAERNKLQSNSKHNMSSWLDSEGDQSQSFIKLYNSSSDSGQKTLKEQFDKWKLLSSAIDENKNKIDALNKSLPETIKYLEDLRLSNTQSYLDKQKQILEDLNYELEVSEKTQSTYLEGTKEYNQEILNQNNLLRDKIAFYKEEIKWTNERLAQGDLTNAQIELLNEYLRENTLALLDTQKAAKSLINTYADDIISNYKRMIEQQRDLELDAIDARLGAENKRHDEYMDNLDEEQKRFEDLINAQQKLLDRQNASKDYETELNKKLSERQKIQDELNRWSMDDSLEGKAKKDELQTQLDAKDEEIERFKLERERVLRKDGLQDQLEDRQKYNEKLKKDEDKLHDNTVDNINDEKKKTEQKYKDILENEKLFYEMKQKLLSEDRTVVESVLTELRGKYATFFEYLKSTAFETSQAFQNMNYSFQTDADKLSNYPVNSGSGNSNGGSSGSGNSNSSNPSSGQNSKDTPQARAAWSSYLSNKKQAEDIRKQMILLDKNSANYKSLESSFSWLNSQNNAIRGRYSFFPDKSYDEIKNIDPFTAKTGGMTPAWGGGEGKWLLAHEKELILNKSDTSNLIKVIDVTRNIVDGIKNLASGDIFSKKTVGESSGNDNRVIIEEVHIHANDKDTGDSLMNKLSSGLSRQNKIGLFKSSPV